TTRSHMPWCPNSIRRRDLISRATYFFLGGLQGRLQTLTRALFYQQLPFQSIKLGLQNLIIVTVLRRDHVELGLELLQLARGRFFAEGTCKPITSCSAQQKRHWQPKPKPAAMVAAGRGIWSGG